MHKILLACRNFTLSQLLHTSGEHAPVVVLKHGFWVLAIDGGMVVDFFFELEAGFYDEMSENVIARLDAVLFGNVGEMIEQWPQVDPQPSRPQHLVDEFDELENVVCTVDKETGDDDVLRIEVALVTVNFDEISGHHGKVGVFGQKGIQVGELNAVGDILGTDIVTILVDVWVDGECILHFALV